MAQTTNLKVIISCIGVKRLNRGIERIFCRGKSNNYRRMHGLPTRRRKHGDRNKKKMSKMRKTF